MVTKRKMMKPWLDSLENPRVVPYNLRDCNKGLTAFDGLVKLQNMAL
jgi:hypothetical protein